MLRKKAEAPGAPERPEAPTSQLAVLPAEGRSAAASDSEQAERVMWNEQLGRIARGAD